MRPDKPTQKSPSAALSTTTPFVVQKANDDGSVTVALRSAALPVPDRYFLAETMLCTIKNRVCRFNFGQFKIGSTSIIKSAVVIDMSIDRVKLVHNTFIGGNYLSVLNSIRPIYTEMTAYPSDYDTQDIHTTMFMSQFARCSITGEGEGYIDFYEFPLIISISETPKEQIHVKPQIRIWSSPPLLMKLTDTIIEFSGMEQK